MGQGSARRSKEKQDRGSDGENEALLTAGDLARLLHVDLKTVHNWVKQGHVFAHRTEGRHLRFQRVQVVRFLRRSGRPVPSEIGRRPARVLVHHAGGKRGKVVDGINSTLRAGLFPAALEAAAGNYEVFVLELDAHSAGLTCELVSALRDRPMTRAIALVGVSRDATRRHEFLACGGDVALPSPSAAIAGTIHWLTGAEPELPRGALTTDTARRR